MAISMYHVGFTSPDPQSARLIMGNSEYLETYLDGLMYIHDLICDLPANPEHREFSPATVYENMAALMKPDVYLSFSNDIRDTAIEIADRMRSNDINAWIWLRGTGAPDENWDAPLKHSTNFVTIISPITSNSKSIQREWEQARTLQKPIILFPVPEYGNDNRIPRELSRAASLKFVRDFDSLIEEIRSGISQKASNETHLPFAIAENLRQNYDAARRIWFLAKLDEYHPASVKEAIENGTLDVESMATRFVNGLLRTCTSLLTIERGIG